MGAIEKPTLKVLCLALLLGTAAPDWAAAQEAAPGAQEIPVVDLGEIDALLESIRARVDGMNATAADTDAAMSFLSDQVEAAIRKLSTREFETEELRKTTRGLADELQTVANNRDQLGFQVTRLTEEKDEIFARLESQVRDLATLLSLEREVATNLRASLEDRSGDLRASLEERDRTTAELSQTRVTLATGQAQSERQLLRLAGLESDIAELRDDRATLAVRLDRTTDELVSTQESLDGARARSQELDQDLSAASSRNDALNDELVATAAQGKGLKSELAVSQSQIEALSQQLAALRAQIAELSGLLQTSDGQTKLQQAEIADLGRRLNLALATKVRELARYRSEFLGRLRAVLGERADVRVVGDRFVFQSEVLFATGEAELEARSESSMGSALRSKSWVSPDEYLVKRPSSAMTVLALYGIGPPRRPIGKSSSISTWSRTHAVESSSVGSRLWPCMSSNGSTPQRSRTVWAMSRLDARDCVREGCWRGSEITNGTRMQPS